MSVDSRGTRGSTSVTVTDTVTGDTRPYGNPFNRAFPPTLDTSAFATCASAPR